MRRRQPPTKRSRSAMALSAPSESEPGVRVWGTKNRRLWHLGGLVIVTAVVVVVGVVQPAALAWTVWGAAGLLVLYLVLVVVMALLLAAFMRPPQPLSEVSILGRYGIGMLKVGLALFAFFANTAVSWTLSVSLLEPVSPRWQGSPPDQIWGVLLQLFVAVVFFYGMAIAVDLLRSGIKNRLSVALRMFSGWGWIVVTGGDPWERFKRRTVLKLAGTHGSIVLFGFFFAPYTVVLVDSLIRLLLK